MCAPGQGQKARHAGSGGQKHGAELLPGRTSGRLPPVAQSAVQDSRPVHQKKRVVDGNAGQQNEAHVRGPVEGFFGDPEHQGNSGEAERYRKKRHERQKQALEKRR